MEQQKEIEKNEKEIGREKNLNLDVIASVVSTGKMRLREMKAGEQNRIFFFKK